MRMYKRDWPQAYATPDDIDLWVGGLAEDAVTAEGSQLGENLPPYPRDPVRRPP